MTFFSSVVAGNEEVTRVARDRRPVFADGDASGPAVDTVVRNARYMVADASSDDLRRLLDHCGRITLPHSTESHGRKLPGPARIGVPQDTRLVLEKPSYRPGKPWR